MPEPLKNVLQPEEIPLDDGQRAQLSNSVERELSAAIDAHNERQKFLAKLLNAYKARPESEVKNFPWPNASNVVIPIVAVTVDTVASRLHRAVFGAKDIVEAKLNTSTPFVMTIPADPNDPMSAPTQKPLEEKDIRDWCAWFLRTSGAGDRLRTVFADMPLYGDSVVSLLWVEEKKTYHTYAPDGSVVALDVPGYNGVKWNVAAVPDVFWPTGYDEWQQLPWQAIRLRYSKPEMMKFVDQGAFRKEDVDALKPTSERQDERRKEARRAERVKDMSGEIYEVFEIRGSWEIPATEGKDAAFEEVVLTYSLEGRRLLRAIYNPYFGKSRHLVKVPYLVQPHEVAGQGVAEQSLPFQIEASTAHNQVIDAATAANAGVTVVSNETNLGPNEEIYPGKTVYTDGSAKDALAIFHLSEPNGVLGQVEEKAFFMNEKRTGVSVYNLGMESPVVGSRATATGTTALINEGNMRFWVSIDDMRKAIEELFYLTIQQEQQMRPEGYFFEKGRYIQFPPGDPRTSIALKLALSSESVNRDIEVQQMQMLMMVVNDYYMRLNQAMMLVANPQFPPQAKIMAVQTMEASSKLVRRFVERFDIENLDEVVPTVLGALQQMAAAMGAAGGQQPMAQPGVGQQALPPGPPRGGPPQAPSAPPGSGSIQ